MRGAAFKRKIAVCLLSAFAPILLVSCRSTGSGNDEAARGLVVVNAPVAGEVRRVLVREGMVVNEGSALVEIAARAETTQPKTAPTEDPVARAGKSVEAAEKEIEAARAEVVRHEVEVQRLTPLVASGAASQAQLDGERALYERAQQRLQRAQAAAKEAQAGVVAARGQNPSGNRAPAIPQEQLTTVRATAAGTVSVVGAREGQTVIVGQPLLTLRAEGR